MKLNLIKQAKEIDSFSLLFFNLVKSPSQKKPNLLHPVGGGKRPAAQVWKKKRNTNNIHLISQGFLI